jgi:hypothetical protein
MSEIKYHPFPETRPPHSGHFYVIWTAFPLGHPKVFSVAFYDAKKGTFVNKSFEGAFNVTAWAFMESKSNA